MSTHNVVKPGYPLRTYAMQDHFKDYLNDSGIFREMAVTIRMLLLWKQILSYIGKLKSYQSIPKGIYLI